jgi:hypothetical protein
MDDTMHIAYVVHISCVFDKNQSLIAIIVFCIFPPPKPVAQDDADSPPGTIAVLVDLANRIAGGKVAAVSVAVGDGVDTA